jgi:mono/diheme cytochrome c family protein
MRDAMPNTRNAKTQGLGFVAAALMCLTLLGLAASAQAPAGNVDHGRQLFQKENCYYCHGTAGQGGRDGARIAATALNVQAFTRYVRRPAGAMPAFTEKLLSDQDLTDIHSFLKSLPAAKPVKEIPLLDQLLQK